MSILSKIDFGNEAGEDIDIEEIPKLFVEQDTFKDFLDYRKKIKVITGKKGVGKSLLLQWLSLKFTEKDKNALVIKCRGSDLTRNEFKLTNPLHTPNDYIKDWMIRISALINRQIASQIKFAITDDQMTLLETAELQGYKQKNFFGSLLARFSIKIKDAPEIGINKQEIQNEISILQRVNDRRIVLIVDDLDATFQNSEAEKISLSTFFSACRYLTQDLKDINFRVTLRTDVWPIIRRFDESLDKLEQYVHQIKWDASDFRNILFRRIENQLLLNNVVIKKFNDQLEDEFQEFVISQVFDNKSNWGEYGQYTYKVLYTLSYKRPRWAIQLCKLTQALAIREHSEKISKSHIDTIWGEYGLKRISDLVSEHKHQCSVVNELINAFRNCNRQMTREELIEIINKKIVTHISVVIDGNSAKSAVEIAHFLFRIGFIVARSESEEEYEHYAFDDMPDLLSSRTCDDFKMKWEIHPCYREALDIKKINKSQRLKRGYK